MPTAVTTFAFASTLQSWSSIAALASGETNGLDTVNGNPADALFGKLVGKTKATTAGAGMKLSQTLTAWGVPAGCTVTAVSVALDKKCVTAPGSAIGSGSFSSKLNLNAGASINSGPTQTLSTTADSVWATLGTGSNAALSGLTDSTLTHLLEVDILYTLSTTSSAVVGTTWQIDWDNVVVTVTYSITAPAAPNTPSGTQSGSAIALTWTDNGTGGSAITNHTMYAYTASSGGSPVATQATGSASTGGSVTGLTPGSLYYFEVTATNTIGESAHSARSASVMLSGIVYAQSGFSFSNGFSVSPAAGSSLVVAAYSTAPSDVLTIGDSGGNTWTPVRSPEAGSGLEIAAWLANDLPGSSITVTTAGYSGGFPGAVWAQYNPVATSTLLTEDQSGGNTSTTSPLTVTTGTTTTADEMSVYVAGYVNVNTVNGPGLPYTQRQSINSILFLSDAHLTAIAADSVTDTTTITVGGELDGILFTLKAIPFGVPLIVMVSRQAVNRSNTY